MMEEKYDKERVREEKIYLFWYFWCWATTILNALIVSKQKMKRDQHKLDM